jgi:hypothetical protein
MRHRYFPQKTEKQSHTQVPFVLPRTGKEGPGQGLEPVRKRKQAPSKVTGGVQKRVTLRPGDHLRLHWLSWK